MAWREKLRNPFVQQYIVEIAFPLIGFFFFDWPLAVITLFYLMDQLASESAFFRRLVRVAVPKNIPVTGLLTSSLALFLALFAAEVFFLVTQLYPLLGDQQETKNAIMTFIKEEAWFLFPLVIFMYHFKDQFLFYMPRRHLHYSPFKMRRYRLYSNVILTGLIMGGVTLWKLVSLPEIVVLLFFLAAKIGFDFTIARWTDRKSKS